MREPACKGKIRYGVLVISLAIHAVALGVFTILKMSGRMTAPVSARASVSVQMIEKVITQPVTKPKPKIAPVSKIQKEPQPEIKPKPKPLVVQELPPVEPVQEPVEAAEVVLPEPAPVANEVEFFGQKSIVQRVCYVVDCSGSMYGQMYRVKEQLKKSIMDLNSRQEFCVLFFMDGREILMTGSGRLEPATIGVKSQALELIERVRPAGSTDAAHALECAMRLRDRDKIGPEVIYFLTDGFSLDEDGSQLFIEKTERLRKSLAPSTVLHTIGFWPQPRDQIMLKTLAGNTGGNYTEVQ